SRRIRDLVADEVVWPDRRSRNTERRARDLLVDHRQTVRDHRSGADGTQVWVRLLQRDAEIRPRLLDRVKVVPQAAHIMDDGGAVTEQMQKESDVGHPHDHAVHPVVEAVERIDLSWYEKPVQCTRNGEHEQEADERDAEEEQKRDDKGADEEFLQNDVGAAQR